MTKLKKPWSQMTAAEKDVQFKINIAHNRSLKKLGLNLMTMTLVPTENTKKKCFGRPNSVKKINVLVE